MTDSLPFESGSLNGQLVRYFYDCLAAQSDWARAINVIEQRDITLVPLAAVEQQRFGDDGFLRMNDADALDLARRVSIGGENASLFLGALFISGCIPARDDRAEKRICAPLLEVPLSLKEESGSQVVVYPDEAEFTINYPLIGELLGGDTDDIQDRLADLSALVPDFPIEPGEFATFWDGFRLIAPEVPVSGDPPLPRSTRTDSTRISDLGLTGESSSRDRDTDPHRIHFVDFYAPRISKDDTFRLLPATAIVLGQKVGQKMSALSELRTMEQSPLSRTAFSAVFDSSTYHCETEAQSPVAESDEYQPLPLSPAQRRIVMSSRSAPLTVVTGPPGTGKSHTITAIVLDALLNGQTVLVASQMDKAVEVVANQTESIAGSLAIARAGGRAAQRQLAKKVARLTGPSSDADNTSPAAVENCAERHRELTRQLQQLTDSFHTVIEAEQQWSQLLQSCQSAEPLLADHSPELDRRHVRRAEARLLRARRHLSTDAGRLRRWWAGWNLGRARRDLQVPADSELSIDQLTAMARFHSLKVQMREIENRLELPFPCNVIWQELDSVQDQMHATAVELVGLTRQQQTRLIVANKQDRIALRDLATLLRRRKREIKLRLRQKLSAELLLRAFPAWACTSRSLCEILPATPALFDIVVIDEASQCDLALASVALMRGKRAVVVGDPNQLRHVCFLSRAREQASFAKHAFTDEMQRRFHYRRSLFDVAADTVDQRSFFFLNEHFRSHPQIIEFSNRRFYDSSLDIMTGRPTQRPQTAIEIALVEGQREVDSSINTMEVQTVVERVKQLIDRSGSGIKKPSIGILSPFRDQADAIRDRLLQELSSEIIADHSIVVGTAHSLQGDEKEIVILSTSIDSQSHPASLRFLEDPNLFNVAITRARRKLIIVTSMSRDELPPGLLRDFFTYSETAWFWHASSDNPTSPIELSIAEKLRTAGIDSWTGIPSAGTRIDVVATGEHNELAILCDRHSNAPPPPEAALASQRQLARAGWRLFRIPHRTQHLNWDRCSDAIANELRRHTS